jgi:hypothetical protein
MTKKAALVYQFKISLDGIKPTIWRRIQVPGNYSFWDLHVAIQDAMGWEDYHLHEFQIRKPGTQELMRIGIPDDDFDWSRETLPDSEIKISEYFTNENRIARYEYDFGDGWIHKIIFKKALEKESGQKYPKCIAGKRACPPEDVGGIGGYYSFLEIIGDPNHLEHERMLEWVGEEYDPEEFEPGEVKFWDPRRRWDIAFGKEDAG